MEGNKWNYFNHSFIAVLLIAVNPEFNAFKKIIQIKFISNLKKKKIYSWTNFLQEYCQFNKFQKENELKSHTKYKV